MSLSSLQQWLCTGRLALAAAALAAASVSAVVPARAEINQLQILPAQFGSTQKVSLGLNKSVLVDLPTDAKEVIVSSPGTASAIMRSKTRAIVQGIGQGATNIFFLDSEGRAITVLDIRVSQEASEIGSALEDTLARVIPGSNIQVETLETAEDGVTHFIMGGTVLTAQDKAVAEALATDLSEGDEPVGSLIQVIGPQQVMLKVTVAEVSRDAIKQLGINFNAGYNTGGLNTGIISNPSVGNASGALPESTITAGVDIGALSIDATLQALERRNAIRTLAEPTLTAMSGQPAEFLAGGQFPIATRDDDGNVEVTYKDFGAKLNFTPVIQSNGLIGLVVDTSVSEPTGNGALQDRRAKTTVELPPGTTLAIGGLIQERVRQEINEVPGLGDIPILGALFRSRDFVSSETELIILVTPYIAQPIASDPILPTDTYEFASDAETIFLGHMEKLYGVGQGHDGLRGSYQGSIGFVLD